MMAHVDLCSGLGGFALGFEWAGLSKPVLFCDIEPWSRKILKKHWPDVPICEDVKELSDDPDRYVSADLDWSNTILTAGYPCQPFSVAGRQRGTEDPRHIWPWLLKLVALKRPNFCVFENVTGHIALGLDKVLNDLEGEDYSIATLIIPASSVGAPHKRERLWIVAHSNSNSQSDVTKHEQERLVANTQSGGRRRNEDIGETQGSSQSDATQFDSFGGVSSRPDNVGNSQHDGSSTSTIKGSNQENARRSTQGAIKAEQSERASGRGHYEDVADTQSARTWQNDSGLRQGAEGIDRGQGTDVADTDSRVGKALNERCLLEQSHTEGQTNRYSNGSLQARTIGQPQPRMGDLADGLSSQLDRFGRHDGFEVEPSDIPRVATGIKDRANRLKGLGNSIVPGGIAMQIGLAIKETL